MSRSLCFYSKNQPFRNPFKQVHCTSMVMLLMRHVTKQDIFLLMNLQQAKIFELIKADCLIRKKILTVSWRCDYTTIINEF